METNKEVRLLKDVMKFRLEFMVTMFNAGRSDMANEALQRLFELIEQVDGEYQPKQ